MRDNDPSISRLDLASVWKESTRFHGVPSGMTSRRIMFTVTHFLFRCDRFETRSAICLPHQARNCCSLPASSTGDSVRWVRTLRVHYTILSNGSCAIAQDQRYLFDVADRQECGRLRYTRLFIWPVVRTVMTTPHLVRDFRSRSQALTPSHMGLLLHGTSDAVYDMMQTLRYCSTGRTKDGKSWVDQPGRHAYRGQGPRYVHGAEF